MILGCPKKVDKMSKIRIFFWIFSGFCMIRPVEGVDFFRILHIIHSCLTPGMVVSQQERYCAIGVIRDRGKALRVIPRGKQRLTVYRAHQVWVDDLPRAPDRCK